MLQQLMLELTSLSQRRKFLKLTTMYDIINGTLYFPTGLYKIIFLIPVVMALLIILDHLLIPTICIHHLSHLLSFCGITYQTVLKLLSLYLRLAYHISKYCYLCSLCLFRHKFLYSYTPSEIVK